MALPQVIIALFDNGGLTFFIHKGVSTTEVILFNIISQRYTTLAGEC